MTIRALEARPDVSLPARRPLRRPATGLAVLLALLLAWAPAMLAQDEVADEMSAQDAAPVEGEMAASSPYTVTTRPGTLPEAPDLVIEDGVVRITLEDAIAIALRRNLDIAVERYDRQSQYLLIENNEGIYDLRTALGASLSEGDTPSATQLEGVPVVTEGDRRLNLSATQLTPWGGEAELSFGATRLSTNSRNVTLDPRYFSNGNFSFTQPLLRGFGRIPTEQGILIARAGSQISMSEFERVVIETVRQVEAAYWGVVEARELFVVAEESLALAQETDRRNRIQVDVGTLAPIELVQSETTIAERREQIISTEASLRDAGDELLRLLNLPQVMADGLEVEALTDPQMPPVDIDLDEAISIAMEERPEILTQRLRVGQLAIDAKVADNQKLPTLDLTAGYGSSGLGGRGQLSEDLFLDTDLGDAFSDVLGRDFTGWNLGLTFAYPLQNRSARANAAIAGLALEQGTTLLDQVELGVVTEVRSAARRVGTAQQQIESARATSRLRQRNLEAEQKRYENGMSDSFRIAEIQNDLVDARSREVRAVTNYRVALAEYYQSIGRLLEQKGITLSDSTAERPEDERRFRFFGLFD